MTDKPEREILILGTDEAGYGPNLGPLLVAASCWRVVVGDARAIRAEKVASLFDFAEEHRVEGEEEEWPSLDPDTLNAALRPISGDRKAVMPLMDSKKLYGPSRSLAALERPFLLALRLLGREPRSLAELCRELRCESGAVPPWEEGATLALPVDRKTLRHPQDGAFSTVQERLSETRVALVDLAARRVHPQEFNAILEREGLKSGLIADVTTSLVVETLARATRSFRDSRPVYALALCDKLGGRDRYVPILEARFPGAEIRTLREARDASVYRLRATQGLDRAGRPVPFPREVALEIRFTAKGEANAPTALASICAKYVRELSMTLFNAFWLDKAGDKTLRPTAGYPVDALRFRDQIAETRCALGIPDAIFWRNK